MADNCGLKIHPERRVPHRGQSDIEPVVEITQRVGRFRSRSARSSAAASIRQYAEDWTLERMLQHTARRADVSARDHDLPVMYVTEDTSAAHTPETIRALYSEALELGAKRLCVCDTVGHSTPAGARAVVRVRARTRRPSTTRVDQASTGTATATATSASPTAWRRSTAGADRACTARRSESVNAPATRRWTCCWSTAGCSAGSTTT